MSKVAVAILNYNGRKHLEQFLPSVVLHAEGADVVVIDNGSTDDSLAYIGQHFPGIKLIRFSQNHGFCGGYNRAMQQLPHELVVLLNSDVEVTADWLPPLIQLFETDPLLVACQPKICSWQHKHLFEYAGAAGGYIDALGYPFCRGRIFDTLEQDTGQYNTQQYIFWASGACMMVRRQAFIEAGGFEERFFAHMEEIDLCWRWQHKGLKIVYQPKSVVYHLGAGTLQKTSTRKTFLNFHNGLCMLFRNHSQGNVLSTVFTRLILDGLAGIQFMLQGKPAHTLAVANAHFAFYKHFKYWYRTRKKIQASRKPGVSYRIYPRYLVWQYFIKKHDTFSSLPDIESVIQTE